MDEMLLTPEQIKAEQNSRVINIYSADECVPLIEMMAKQLYKADVLLGEIGTEHHGWRAIERYFNSYHPVVKKWLEWAKQERGQ